MTFISSHPRVADDSDIADRVPVYVVWELTLSCNLRCSHCGSRAGDSRSVELSTDECLDLVDQLAELGTREITIIGGEAYLRKDWLDIIKRICEHGILCTLQTGGYGLGARMIERAKDAGLGGIGVSIDGTEATHDLIRGRVGSFRSALSVLAVAHDIGIETSVNTQINALSRSQLGHIYEEIKACRIKAWQLQLTVAMGNAVDNSDILLQPYELAQLMPEIASLSERSEADGIRLTPGNNIGYFGPYEHLLRGPTYTASSYDGCRAGIDGLGIEADGTIKGCPSLATSRYSEGSIRDRSLLEIWNDKSNFTLNRGQEREYGGYCAGCYYRSDCRSGCVWTSDSLLGSPGNNPYCYHRVLELKKSNIRERVVKSEDAPDKPFSVGKFLLVEEEWRD